MFNKNGNLGKAIRAFLGAVALLIVAGGLVSCDFGGGEPDNETEQQRNEDNEDKEDDDDD